MIIDLFSCIIIIKLLFQDLIIKEYNIKVILKKMLTNI
jgi:hypothetical protein